MFQQRIILLKKDQNEILSQTGYGDIYFTTDWRRHVSIAKLKVQVIENWKYLPTKIDEDIFQTVQFQLLHSLSNPHAQLSLLS